MKGTGIKLVAATAAGVLTFVMHLHAAIAGEVVVIVNANNPIVSITPDQVEQMFLGKTTTLPGGGNASPVDQVEGSPVRNDFYEKATGKSAAQVKAIWSRLVFSGKGLPPKVLGSSNDVKKFVAGAPNSIGYIEKSEVDSSVKIVLLLP